MLPYPISKHPVNAVRPLRGTEQDRSAENEGRGAYHGVADGAFVDCQAGDAYNCLSNSGAVMGVGYVVSPLHRIGYLDDPPGPPHCVRPEDLPPHSIQQLLARYGCFDSRPIGPFRSPTVADILAWRAHVALRYRTQLAGDDLDWNEESSFEQSQDVTDNGDVVLRYAAAVLDLHGETDAAHILAASSKPPYPELTAIFNQVSRRDFGGRFPQLLLVPSIGFLSVATS